MDPKQLMGFETPGDQKVSVTVRDWEAMRRAIWRSAIAWEIVVHEADEILDRCKHVEGCPGIESETEACLQDKYGRPQTSHGKLRAFLLVCWAVLVALFVKRPVSDTAPQVIISHGCPDREIRMSALVILNAARQHSPTDATKPSDGPYFAPSREYFSEVLSSLHAAQVENQELRKTQTVTIKELP